MTSARHVRLSRRLIEQAALVHVGASYRAKGIQCMGDIEFLNKAQLTFVGPDGRQVAVAALDIVWDE